MERLISESDKYIKLISRCLEVNSIKLLPNNEDLFLSQKETISKRYCFFICPKCLNETRTRYDDLSRGIIRCKKCANNKPSFSYNQIIDLVNKSAKDIGYTIEFSKNNEDMFNVQLSASNKKICYFKCPNCLILKSCKYKELLYNKRFLCINCTLPINEYNFSYLFSNLLKNISHHFNIKSDIYTGPNKIVINSDTRFVPDIFIKSINNGIIEYNGSQHYKANNKFGGTLCFDKQLIRDNKLKQYCINNNIILLEVDGRKTFGSRLNFIQYFNSDVFIEFLSRILNIDFESIKKFIMNFSFEEFKFKPNPSWSKIVNLFFVDGLSTHKISNHYGFDRKYVSNILKSFLNNDFDIERVQGIDYSKDRFKELIKINFNKNAKLTKENVMEIRKLLESNINIIEIANKFGVRKCAIYNIKNGISWKTDCGLSHG